GSSADPSVEGLVDLSKSHCWTFWFVGKAMMCVALSVSASVALHLPLTSLLTLDEAISISCGVTMLVSKSVIVEPSRTGAFSLAVSELRELSELLGSIGFAGVVPNLAKGDLDFVDDPQCTACTTGNSCCRARSGSIGLSALMNRLSAGEDDEAMLLSSVVDEAAAGVSCPNAADFDAFSPVLSSKGTAGAT